MTNPLRRAGRSPRMIAPALFLLCVLAVPGAADEQERVLFDNNNPAGVRSGPRNETTFRLTERHVITSVRTYHWNGGRGAAPGWVMIDCDPEGLSYGRWKGVGQGARSGGAPIYWLAKPNLEFRPGVYTIRVSRPKTWAHNAASGHAGIVTVRGVPVRKTPPAAESPEPSPPSSEPKPPETTAPEPTPPALDSEAGTGGGGATTAPRFEVPARIVVTPPKDLMNEAEWPTGDVLWSPAGAFTPPKTTAEPIEVAAPLDFAALDLLAYAASITAAKEGLRVIQGPMTPEQHRTYEEKWAPYYDFPSESIVAYLNQLNPLLVRFLAVRSGFTAASQGIQAAPHPPPRCPARRRRARQVPRVHLPAFARAIEGARTLEKEMRTKMLPYLERRMLEAHARGDTAMLKRLTAIRNHWMGIYGQVAAIGKPGGPAPQQLWTMVQRLQTSTGGLDVDGIADLLASGWDAMARWEPR